MKNYYVFLCSIVFLGCSLSATHQQNAFNQPVLPVIDLEQALNKSCTPLKLSEFVDSIEYIPLETKENSYIGNRGNFFMTDKHFFYDDLMFELNGKFVRKIGKIGKGPGEFLVPRGMSVEEQYQEFYIYDNYGGRIMIYDLNGTFKRSVSVSRCGSGITPIGNRYFYMGCDIAYGPETFDYCILNIGDGDTVRLKRTTKLKELSTSGTRNYGLGFNVTWHYDHALHYYEFLSDTIYTVSPFEEIPRYVVNCGKYKIPFNMISTARGNAIYDYLRIREISESSDYLFLSFDIKRQLYYAYFNKKTKETHADVYDKVFVNDIDGGPIWLLQNNVADGSVGFYFFTPEWAKENLEMMFRKNKGYDQVKNERLKKMVDRSGEEDNPIAYIFHFK